MDCADKKRATTVISLIIPVLITLVMILKLMVTTTLTLRRLMSYIYMQHAFLMFLDHTQRRSTVGRTPLDE